MASIKLSNAATPKVAAAYGNAWVDDGKVTVPTLAIADEIVLGRVPAGTRITGIKLRNAALGAGLTVDFGFRPYAGDSTLAADAAYFASGSTALATASSGDGTALVFDPITFPEDVTLVATVKTAAETPAAGSLTVFTTGRVIGPR